MTLPIRQGRGGGMEEPAPRRKHSERQPGESYPDALSRVAGERDAALHDVARLSAARAPDVAYLEAAAEYWRAKTERLQAILRDFSEQLAARRWEAPYPPEPPVGTRLRTADTVHWTRHDDGWHCATDDCTNCPCDWEEAWERRGARAETMIVLPGSEATP